MMRRMLCIFMLCALATAAQAQPAAPAACAEPDGCVVQVDTVRAPSGAPQWVHKAWIAAPDDYLQVWASPETNSVQHWHRRWPNRRACGIRGVVTSCRGKESLPYYRVAENE